MNYSTSSLKKLNLIFSSSIRPRFRNLAELFHKRYLCTQILFSFRRATPPFLAQGWNSVHRLTVVAGFAASQTAPSSNWRLERRIINHVANHNHAKAGGICKLTVYFPLLNYILEVWGKQLHDSLSSLQFYYLFLGWVTRFLLCRIFHFFRLLKPEWFDSWLKILLCFLITPQFVIY